VGARVDYETHGRGYSRGRRADPRIAARIEAAIGDARTVLNVGAGTGSYEPRQRWVLAVEPSATMRGQRPVDAAPCVAATAESLPRFATPEQVAAELGGEVRIERMPTPADCADGFFEAFWNRPEALLDPEVRASQSLWALLGPGVEEAMVERLRSALESGAWDAAHGHLREQASFDGSLRLVVSEPRA
jgi:hypothetical protein